MSSPVTVSDEPTVRARRLTLPSANAVAWAAIVVLAAVRAGSPEERDPYWETRAGVENLQGLSLSRPDTWSWAGVGGDWYQNSPAWNTLLGISWLGGGFWGLFVVGFAAIFSLFALSYVVARRLGAHPLGALAAVVAAFVWAMPMVSSRATVGVQALLLLGMLLPTWWRPYVPRRSVLVNALVPAAAGLVVGVVGNWVHLSFLLMGPALAACWAVYWLVSDWPGSWRARLTDARRLALAVGGLVGMAVGTLLTPYGVALTVERSRITAAVCADYILEWVSPFSTAMRWQLSLQWGLAGLYGLATAGLLTWWWVRQVRARGLDNQLALAATIGVLGVPLTLAGAFALRFLGSGILLLAPVVGLGITVVAQAARRGADRLADTHRLKETATRWTQTRPWRVVLAIVWLLLLPFALYLGPGRHAVPDETAAIRSLPTGCRLYTTAAIAAPAILVRPDVPVWFDGRADYYGRDRLAEAAAYATGSADTAAPPGATCVVLPVVSAKDSLPAATQRITADPAWRLTGTYDGFDVWVRATA